jgi:hypothetical protein
MATNCIIAIDWNRDGDFADTHEGVTSRCTSSDPMGHAKKGFLEMLSARHTRSCTMFTYTLFVSNRF